MTEEIQRVGRVERGERARVDREKQERDKESSGFIRETITLSLKHTHIRVKSILV